MYNYASQLAVGRNLDWEVLTAACFLHDIAAYYPQEVGDNYHQEDALRARKILEELDFPKAKIDKVIDAIAAHGSDQTYQSQRTSIEAIILCDADKLDAFGPIGVTRIIMVRTLRGDTLEEIVEDFHTRGHLKKKWDTLTLDQTKKIAKKDYEYSVTFFTRLSQTI